MARSPWGGCITQETFSGKRIWNCLFALLGVKHSDNLPHCQWDTFCGGGGGGEYWKSPADRHWQKFSQLSPVVDWDEVPTGIKALEIKWLLLSPIMCE